MAPAVSAAALDAAVPAHPVALSASEITGLIGLFQQMLDTLESRVLARIDLFADGANERWKRHDDDAERYRDNVTARFVRIEETVDKLAAAVADHHARQHDEDVAMDARVRPIRTVSGWLWSNRTNLLVLLIGLFGALTFLFDRLIGSHP